MTNRLDLEVDEEIQAAASHGPHLDPPEEEDVPEEELDAEEEFEDEDEEEEDDEESDDEG
jgi:hypothetical protein